MRLESTFIQLPCLFDQSKLQQDISALPNEAWRSHPQGFAGNSAVSLIARHGDANDDRTYGSMQATQWLDQLPYIKAVMAYFKTPLGRSRLMRIEGDAQVPSHTDLDYYWQGRMRLHVPIITNPSVRFECGDDAVHMSAGEAWVFDTTELHRVLNEEGGERIHLVFDTVGSAHLYDLISKFPSPTIESLDQTPLSIEKTDLLFESHNRPQVMSPYEQQVIMNEFLGLLTTEHDPNVVESIATAFKPVMHDWRAAWAQYGTNPSGHNTFIELQKRLAQIATNCGANRTLRNSAIELWLQHWLVDPAVDVDETKNTSRGHQTPKSNQVEQAQMSFDSQYTDSLPGLIAHLNGTLVATTYASNRVVLMRSDGHDLNTHFKDYTGPMGLAYDDNHMALGVQNAIWIFRSQPDLGAALQPNCDAVYVPFKQHMTGDIRIHELGWSDNELWLVNTRFSCLATLDEDHSFKPRWHPKFIKDLSAEDACHLNGMAMRDGKPAWVTALGISDQPGGWRAHKLQGGVVIDVASGEVATDGLCMPHSPRWHGNNLWVLDSGRGELCQVNPQNGQRETVAKFPGFTRGLAMIDRYAFVGCSRVREKAWFGGLPILDQDKPPECGVWVVDLVTGQIIGWIVFANGLDEIFDLQWLPGQRWPDILEPDEPTARNGFSLPAEKINHFNPGKT